MKTILNEKFYSISDIALLLALSETTIRNYIRAGKLTANKIGKELYISEHTLKKFLQIED